MKPLKLFLSVRHEKDDGFQYNSFQWPYLPEQNIYCIIKNDDIIPNLLAC